MTAPVITHLRHNVVAYLALVVAMGGTSYAAVALPKDSVGPAQIRTGAVRSDEVADRSLKASDFARGQLPRGARGPRGVKGVKGAQGVEGAVGPAGPTFGAVEGNDPVADPDVIFGVASFTFTLPAAGPTLISNFRTNDTITCQGGANGSMGLYVDGEPVPHSERTVAAGPNSYPFEIAGIITLAAGTHTVDLRTNCYTTYQSSGVGITNRNYRVVLLKSAA